MKSEVVSNFRLGIDIGSTNTKAVIFNEERDFLFSSYRRHKAGRKSLLNAIVRAMAILTPSKWMTKIIQKRES